MIPKACYVSQKWGDLVKLKAKEEKIDFSNWKYFFAGIFYRDLATNTRELGRLV